MNIFNCYVSAVLGFAMLGASALTMTVSKDQHDELKKVFSDDLDKIYDNIVRERRDQYLEGLVIGFVVAAVFLHYYKDQFTTRFHRVMSFFAISLVTAMIFYMLMPKSDYMLNHLKTQEENKAWLKMYKTMQSRYLLGMLLGALSAIPIANAYCG